MKKFVTGLLFFSIALVLLGQWQPDDPAKKEIYSRLYGIVEYLAADSLEGRESGTKGEILARDFIVNQFKEIGVDSYFPDGSYYKEFSFSSSHKYSPESRISIGKTSYFIENDFTVVSYFGRFSSKSKTQYVGNGLVIPEEGIDDYQIFEVKDLKDKVFLIDVAFPKSYSFITEDNYYQIVQEIIYTAIQKGAAIIILYQSHEKGICFHRNSFFQNSRKGIPVFFAEGNFRKQMMKGGEEELVFQILSNRDPLTSYNVAAVINNNAPTTIVIGGHYDHLGYGSFNSRHVGPPMLHPGADDNASGIAVMLEIARYVKSAGLNNHNYVFAAFGAEEKGLIGSKAFVEDSICNIDNVIAMINLDMVGRLDSASRKLNVLGTGSSAKWDSLLNVAFNPNIDLNRNPSGTGGSDQMYFFMKDIPVLFFITGIHRDYHTPSDVLEKVNFSGMLDITVFVTNLLHHLNNVSHLPFVEGENKEQLVDRSYTRGVTLGVIPDHTFGGKGMRIDDVFPGRNADMAGIKTGDIIVAIDQHEVSDLTTYMKALSNFGAGASADVKIIRGTEEFVIKVTF